MIGAVRGFAQRYLPDRRVCVGLSGGADSLALTAAALRAGLEVTALVVDHRLQEGSAIVAERAAETARALGAQARVLTVDVTGPGGPEAAARTARYGALEEARAGGPVLLGHTLDDQAETVLLGLGRGSGARSLSGMAPWRAPWGRPLLPVRRARTRQACADWGISVWDDPHNDDPRFTRVRLRREVLPLLDEVLGGGVPAALARTADQLRADTEALDVLAVQLLTEARSDDGLDAHKLAAAPAAVCTRAVRSWLLEIGAAEPGARTVAQVEALIADWHGQGPVAVGGDAEARLVVTRRASLLRADRAAR
nr:tRNA lysidine(34) synthetase TilS [Gordonia hirsuta]